MTRQTLLFALAASLMAACSLPEGHELPDPGEPDQPSADPVSEAPEPVEPLQCQQGIGTANCDCTENNCGQNSPVIDGVYFSKLHQGGEPNPQGFRLVGFAANENAARAGNWLPRFGDGDRVFGDVLYLNIGQYFVLQRGTTRYLVKLADKSPLGAAPQQPYWAHPTNVNIPWYRFVYAKQDLLASSSTTPEYEDVCKSTPLGPGWETLGAMVFEGNIYDQVNLKVESSPTIGDQTWFNIACFGSLPAKMFATRRTQLHGASLAEQQAFVNMWSGNYCGDGEPFTRAGWPLLIRDDKQALTNGSIGWDHDASFTDDEFGTVDAVWNAKGAVCMDIPRRDAAPLKGDNIPPGGASSWRQAIEAKCGRPIPSCTTNGRFPLRWQNLGSVISVNPRTLERQPPQKF